MNECRLLIAGVVGGVVAAICCFTPVLVALFAALGLSALIAWLDYLLLPALALSSGSWCLPWFGAGTHHD